MKLDSCNSIFADLKVLIQLLKKYDFNNKIIDLASLDRFIGNRKNATNHTYNINDIIFYVSDSGMKANPEVKSISVTIDSTYTLLDKPEIGKDIFSDYSLELILKGENKNKAASKNDFSFFCWHLDKELKTDGDYSHPYYHFHAGGRHVSQMDTGDLLMLSSPRIPHPPMDIVLAIHFVILNFLNKGDFPSNKKILEDDSYISIIEHSQKRFVDPYFGIINRQIHSDLTPHNLFPMYI